ncbi:hypothetical protein P7C73_g4121, partial [Tremellales sp. Uapishka_1]
MSLLPSTFHPKQITKKARMSPTNYTPTPRPPMLLDLPPGKTVSDFPVFHQSVYPSLPPPPLCFDQWITQTQKDDILDLHRFGGECQSETDWLGERPEEIISAILERMGERKKEDQAEQLEMVRRPSQSSVSLIGDIYKLAHHSSQDWRSAIPETAGPISMTVSSSKTASHEAPPAFQERSQVSFRTESWIQLPDVQEEVNVVFASKHRELVDPSVSPPVTPLQAASAKDEGEILVTPHLTVLPRLPTHDIPLNDSSDIGPGDQSPSHSTHTSLPQAEVLVLPSAEEGDPIERNPRPHRLEKSAAEIDKPLPSSSPLATETAPALLHIVMPASSIDAPITPEVLETALLLTSTEPATESADNCGLFTTSVTAVMLAEIIPKVSGTNPSASARDGNNGGMPLREDPIDDKEAQPEIENEAHVENVSDSLDHKHDHCFLAQSATPPPSPAATHSVAPLLTKRPSSPLTPTPGQTASATRTPSLSRHIRSSKKVYRFVKDNLRSLTSATNVPPPEESVKTPPPERLKPRRRISIDDLITHPSPAKSVKVAELETPRQVESGKGDNPNLNVECKVEQESLENHGIEAATTGESGCGEEKHNRAPPGPSTPKANRMLALVNYPSSEVKPSPETKRLVDYPSSPSIPLRERSVSRDDKSRIIKEGSRYARKRRDPGGELVQDAIANGVMPHWTDGRSSRRLPNVVSETEGLTAGRGGTSKRKDSTLIVYRDDAALPEKKKARGGRPPRASTLAVTVESPSALDLEEVLHVKAVGIIGETGIVSLTPLQRNSVGPTKRKAGTALDANRPPPKKMEKVAEPDSPSSGQSRLTKSILPVGLPPSAKRTSGHNTWCQEEIDIVHAIYGGQRSAPLSTAMACHEALAEQGYSRTPNAITQFLPPAPQNHLQQQQPPPQAQQQLWQSPNQAQPPSQNPTQNQVAQAGPSWQPRPTYSYQPQPQTQLHPQPLESVGKDEDPIYGPLSRARGKIERGLVSDNEITNDLADLFPFTNANDAYASIQGNKVVRIVKTTPLPDALLQELNYKHLTAKNGLFEEIERAWFTVDNKLFLWNYNDGRDFNRYDEQDDTIESVGLVRARKDVFVDDMTHVLVICTARKATLLGLSKGSDGGLSLYHTGLSTDTPTAMISIQGTPSGRIFMNGFDKNLYELDYSSGSQWFSSSKVSLTNRSSGSFSAYLPSIFSSSSPEGVESFVIDYQQSRLYTLHTKGEIEMFDISATNFTSRGKYTKLKSELARMGAQNQDVVAISVVGLHESRKAGLVAITSNGTRVYFSSTPFGPSVSRAPPENMKLSSQSIYSSGTLVAVQPDTSTPTPSTRLTFTVQNSGRQPSLRENYDNFESPMLQEWFATEAIPSQVWTVVEVSSQNPAFSSSALLKEGVLSLTPLARQTSSEARQFLILASSGIFWAILPRPIDMLQSELEGEKDSVIAAVRATFGKTQLASMGVMLGANSDPKHSEIMSAVNAILLGAGTPFLKDGTAGKSIVYSARHDGLALFIARLLRPIWNVRVTAPAVGGRQVLGVSEGQLLAVQGRLERLRRFVDEHPFPRNQADGDIKIAWDQEELSLHGLAVLLKQSVEAISFVLLLLDYKISDVIARCDGQLQSTLSSLNFQGLLTAVEGREVARKLVTALIEQQIGQELGIDTLSEILQQRCGTFCQPGDVVMYKAEENMRRAESLRDYSERNDSLAESLRLFSKAASSLQIPRLQEVSKRYRTLQYTVGAIELPLKCAADLDPSDKAGDYVREGRHEQDPRKGLYDQRMACYECVIEALGMYDEQLDRAAAEGSTSTAIQKRDEAYGIAIASEDELFHFYLYDWHVSRNLQDQLLEFDTPFIERYLQLTSSDLEDRRDLLWKFYARREDFLPAAKALAELATRPSSMNLHDRVYYLAQALTNAKSAAGLGSEDVEFTNGLQERIDVAQVQMEIARAIENHLEMTDQEKSEQLGSLDGRLLGLDDLYQSFARPLRLYEPILLILKTADTRIDEVIEAVWKQLLTDCNAAGYLRVGELITDLFKKYYPSEAVPLEIVLPVVFAHAAAHFETSSAGWASLALLDGGLGIRDLFEAIVALRDQEEVERDFYDEEASVVLSKWLDQKDSIPAAEVERFASGYLLQSTGSSVDPRKVQVRDRMHRAKVAAGRY